MTKLILNLLCLSFSLFVTASFAEQNTSDDIDAKVVINDGNVIVDLSMMIDATPQQVWAVLTDIDHMAGFITNLKESRLVSTSGATLTIFQRGEANFGMMSFPFQSTRELMLSPFEKIQSHLISGTMHKMEGTTQLSAEGDRTKLTSHTESIPGNWIPPVVGRSFIEHETREQYQQIRKEVLKRKLSSATATN